VYRPILDTLATRRAELEQRGKTDAQLAGQLRVFPVKFDIVLDKPAACAASCASVLPRCSSSARRVASVSRIAGTRPRGRLLRQLALEPGRLGVQLAERRVERDKPRCPRSTGGLRGRRRHDQRRA